MIDTTTALESAVFVTAAISTGFALVSLFVSHTDHLVLRRLRENGVKHLTLTARLVRDLARAACAMTMLAASAICLHLPPNHRVAVITMKLAVLCTSIFLSVAVISDFRWRRLIDAALAELDERPR